MSSSEHTAQIELRPIPGFPNYMAGDDGSLWSPYRRGNGRKLFELRKMSPTLARTGYYVQQLITEDGQMKLVYVHAMILLAFVGQRPDGFHCCHNNGVKTDCRPSNLRWDTIKSNVHDRSLHGTGNIGSRHGNAKLTEVQVVEIRERKARTGESNLKISKDYGVSQGIIRRVVSGDGWKHVV